MKLIIIDRKAWERHCSEFADFIHSIEQLIGNPPETDEWLDNEAVCRRLGISKRTLFPELEAQATEIMNHYKGQK
mgnify:CR=1 FL=1